MTRAAVASDTLCSLVSEYNRIMLFRKPKDFIEMLPQALEPHRLEAINRQVTESRYLQQNVLNARFAATMGFSVIFREPADLLAQFGELGDVVERLQRGAPKDINLYYLNVLVIRTAGKVDRHVDHSIRGYDATLPLPWRVSVLYLQVPRMEGGELLLYDGKDQLSRRISPETGLLVHFSGHSKHAVGAIAASDDARVSLVCEQYRLNRKQLQAVPAFTIKSMAPFSAFLEHQL